ncbi:MAG: hypothetical protein IPG45_33575 [Deltaproteobacteria bacterium]|nr:hypothetical protein [Deltaproteobacteria bacterium]
MAVLNSMLPLDPLIGLLQKVILLMILLVAWRLKPRSSDEPLWPRFEWRLAFGSQQVKRPLGFFFLLSLLALSGWLDTSSQIGPLLTLNSALGGVDLTEVLECRAASAGGAPPTCPYGGNFKLHEGSVWVCDKHGPARTTP